MRQRRTSSGRCAPGPHAPGNARRGGRVSGRCRLSDERRRQTAHLQADRGASECHWRSDHGPRRGQPGWCRSIDCHLYGRRGGGSGDGKVTILRHTAIQDAGKAIHPSYVEGQIEGGAVQGVGWALNEEYYFNDEGHMVNSSFLDYRMPTSLDLPMIDTVIVEVPNPNHPLGCGAWARWGLCHLWRRSPMPFIVLWGCGSISCPCRQAVSWRPYGPKSRQRNGGA